MTGGAVAEYFDQTEAVTGNSMLWADRVSDRRLRQWSKDLLGMPLRQALYESEEAVRGGR